MEHCFGLTEEVTHADVHCGHGLGQILAERTELVVHAGDLLLGIADLGAEVAGARSGRLTGLENLVDDVINAVSDAATYEYVSAVSRLGRADEDLQGLGVFVAGAAG